MLETWQLIFQIIYGIPLFGFYIFILVLFLKPSNKSVFKSSFFKISTVIGFVDITSYITTWGMLKLPSCELTYRIFPGTESLFLYPIGSFLAYYCTAIRYYLLIASSANRLTAVAIPSQYEKLWLKYITLIIVLCFLIPIPLNFHILFGKTSIYPSPPVVGIDVKAAWFPISRALLNAIQSSLTSVLTFLFNALTLYLLSLRKTQNKASLNKAEIGLLFICCYDFVINLLFALHQTSMYVNSADRNATYLQLLQLVVWIYDLNNLSRPIFFFFMCKPIRISLSQILSGKSNVRYNRTEMSKSRSKIHIAIVS